MNLIPKKLAAKYNITQVCAYLFWGVASMGFNLAFFKLLLVCGLDYRIANIITLVILKFFVFATNKFFVFKTAHLGLKATTLEFMRFLGARAVTNLIDYFGVIILVEVAMQDAFYSKIFMLGVMVILNFIFSKLFVFRKNDTKQTTLYETSIKNE